MQLLARFALGLNLGLSIGFLYLGDYIPATLTIVGVFLCIYAICTEEVDY